jgi:hypothetical protein
LCRKVRYSLASFGRIREGERVKRANSPCPSSAPDLHCATSIASRDILVFFVYKPETPFQHWQADGKFSWTRTSLKINYCLIWEPASLSELQIRYASSMRYWLDRGVRLKAGTTICLLWDWRKLDAVSNKIHNQASWRANSPGASWNSFQSPWLSYNALIRINSSHSECSNDAVAYSSASRNPLSARAWTYIQGNTVSIAMGQSYLKVNPLLREK